MRENDITEDLWEVAIKQEWNIGMGEDEDKLDQLHGGQIPEIVG